ncbi:MAG: hypothetical protein A2268_16080 [Candidatus Raymondbacteria bacterium RifOxyA12_full_50_37]|uniref:PDZ domain-containing protein n=1 Tax=Candidatus Raymondbacteria bacterium RIFOXYD12_FULL_49_13 TaxID=1817890 RepID=A0A1F7FBP1_UNCRA|nr:MAG: hypothetical protein A2268_16080 [Candidatus Raymondbacteria bacterium RifOxyA12_full_50_37]OGJ94319.1 MAG: hypothetical protein A2248_14275 [Candidatus Raymondbacteria bacterium RIFOXYA2_FULL_49_16]OGJ94501.1 MAG: hypothetical protein A2350_07890 [Candidatus Raymondbacteria bacterium RifOxyB12_full_50_8]OGJ95261.1 MAG: hypothetical protein A2453_05700 [Candidatus Raymondbacteria bacterium RIFOXYC2_FULL_50_21]OGK04100.1 MAG: hypothetical protein A2519_19545 [Candidatus Raymondbacteria b
MQVLFLKILKKWTAMNIKKTTAIVLFIVAGILLPFSWVYNNASADGDDFYESIIRFDDIIRKIKTHYVVDVPAESLIVYAVDGMRDILDPHTNYFKEKEYKDLMVKTKGEFGGLGITIGIRENILTIIAPLPNTPASKVGLIAGDRIVKINGKSTAGIQIDEAVEKLRGKKGTTVTITIERQGVIDPFDVTVERDIIKIKSVQYSGMIDEKNKVGYILLVSFTEKSSSEMEAALRALQAQGMASLVLDLRSNPGGLLKQAVEVSEKFIGPGKMIVFTKGRDKSSMVEFKAQIGPTLSDKTPLVVLVNEGSASASEIVAGAIQDHDRGVVMGSQTYGKGSVQTILPLENNHALKLTTAYYYTPVGRCINMLANDVGQKRHEEQNAEAEMDEEGNPIEPKKDSVKTQKEEFKTLTLGRSVYGSGGITPDVDIDPEHFSRLEIEIVRKSMFFNFTVAEINRMKAKKQSIDEKTFKVSDDIYTNFIAYLQKEKFEYKSPEQTVLEELKKTVSGSRKDPADTSKILQGPYDKDMDRKIAEVESLTVKNRDYAFTRYKKAIVDRLTRDFLNFGVSEEAFYRYALRKDKFVITAIDLLKDQKRYNRILSKDFKKETP